MSFEENAFYKEKREEFLLKTVFKLWVDLLPELAKEKCEVESSYDAIINKFRYVSSSSN